MTGLPLDSATENHTRVWAPPAGCAAHAASARWRCTTPREGPHARRTRGRTPTHHEHNHGTAAAAMASGGEPRPEDDGPFSDGDASDYDSADESRPRRMGARRPGGASNNPILTRLAVSRNPSPLAAATAAPGVCLLRFAWESAAGSLVGAVVGYGKPTPLPVVPAPHPCLPVRMEGNLGLGFRAQRRRGDVRSSRHFGASRTDSR